MHQLHELTLYDRWAAAFALATGAVLLTVTEDHNGWQCWVFDDRDGQASRALGEWRAGAPLVNAKHYAEACRRLRRIGRV